MTSFTESDREILRRVPTRRPRGGPPNKRPKLTPEQVIELRRRMDSLTTPWSIRQLAHDFGVSVAIVMHVVRRKTWDDSAYEPGQREWWWREQHRRRE